MLCWQERIFLREIFALFAVNPGLDFHREGAKHAKDFSLVAALLLCETSPYFYHFPNFHRVAAFNDFFSARPNATRGRNSNIGSSW